MSTSKSLQNSLIRRTIDTQERLSIDGHHETDSEFLQRWMALFLNRFEILAGEASGVDITESKATTS